MTKSLMKTFLVENVAVFFDLIHHQRSVFFFTNIEWNAVLTLILNALQWKSLCVTKSANLCVTILQTVENTYIIAVEKEWFCSNMPHQAHFFFFSKFRKKYFLPFVNFVHTNELIKEEKKWLLAVMRFNIKV